MRRCLVPLSSEIHIVEHHPSKVLDDENASAWMYETRFVLVGTGNPAKFAPDP